MICASTGNTAASAAAYARRVRASRRSCSRRRAQSPGEARADPDARRHGARGAGDFDEALAAAQELGGRGSHVLVNSLNPYRREGQKTAVLEVVEELGGAPDAFRAPTAEAATPPPTRKR